MTSNAKRRSQERVETTVNASQLRYIDDSRYEAEVSPYSFERDKNATASIDEKD